MRRAWDSILVRVRALLQPGTEARELEEELQHHIERDAARHVAAGMTPEEALSKARRQFGNLTATTEMARSAARPAWLEQLAQDIRYSFRTLRRTPGFTTVAVLSLAMGIGATSAIYSVISALMLRPLPVASPKELSFFTLSREQGPTANFSYPLFEKIFERARSFSGVVASGGTDDFRLIVLDSAFSAEPDLVRAEKVSTNFFSVLGVRAVAGRVLGDAHDNPNEPRAEVVLSHAYWQRRFGADPRVVGARITLNGAPFTIVGVAPPRFTGIMITNSPDVWWPVRLLPRVNPDNASELTTNGSWWIRVMGRRQPGVSQEQAHAESDVIVRQHLAEVAATASEESRRSLSQYRVQLQSGATGFSYLRWTYTRPLFTLFGAVACVLLIACANVAGLQLTRLAGRRREIALRLAIGASRARVARQLMTESLVLAGSAAVIGLVFAVGGSRVLLAFLPASQGINLDARLDLRVVAFTALIAVVSGLLFGLAPALRTIRQHPTAGLKSQGLSTGRRWGRDALVVAQVALSVCVLVGAGLFLRTLSNLKNIDPGFVTEGLVMFDVDWDQRTGPERGVLRRQMLESFSALPGVHAASVSNESMLGGGEWRQLITAPGFETASEENLYCTFLIVSSAYFQTMKMQLVAGSDFSGLAALVPVDSSRPPPPRLVVINEATAQHFFPGQNPIGKLLGIGRNGPQGEVIGVVRDAKYGTLRPESKRTVWLLTRTLASNDDMVFTIRTTGQSSAVIPSVRRVVREAAPGLIMRNVRSMDEVVDETLARERMVAELAGFFGLFALALAGLGLYGNLAFSVARRTKEIGIRMALGTRASQMIALVLRRGMLLTLAGCLLGVGLSLVLSRLTAALLFGVTPTDAATFVAACAVLIAVAFAACLVPARRAAAIDPMVALRHD